MVEENSPERGGRENYVYENVYPLQGRRSLSFAPSQLSISFKNTNNTQIILFSCLLSVSSIGTQAP